MFVSKYLTGRIQCVDGDFVCINLHFRGQLATENFFIDQIYINKRTGTYHLPNFDFKLSSGISFNSTSLKDEMQSIVNQYYKTCSALGLD